MMKYFFYLTNHPIALIYNSILDSTFTNIYASKKVLLHVI